MKPPIVIIGIGELASVFARAFLRNGNPVYPVTRAMSIAEEAEKLPEPQLVLVAVAEKDFNEIMETIPTDILTILPNFNNLALEIFETSHIL